MWIAGKRILRYHRSIPSGLEHERSAKIRFLLFLVLLGGTFIAFWLLRLDSYVTNSGISSVSESPVVSVTGDSSHILIRL